MKSTPIARAYSPVAVQRARAMTLRARSTRIIPHASAQRMLLGRPAPEAADGWWGLNGFFTNATATPTASAAPPSPGWLDTLTTATSSLLQAGATVYASQQEKKASEAAANQAQALAQLQIKQAELDRQAALDASSIKSDNTTLYVIGGIAVVGLGLLLFLRK